MSVRTLKIEEASFCYSSVSKAVLATKILMSSTLEQHKKIQLTSADKSKFHEKHYIVKERKELPVNSSAFKNKY